MFYIYDIMKFNPTHERELQKREGPRRDRVGPIKWKNLEAQIGGRWTMQRPYPFSVRRRMLE